jgi:hypothetical protein
MKNHSLRWWILVLLLVACNSTAVPAASNPPATPTVARPTETATLSLPTETASPLPPTETPEQAITPSPTETPTPEVWEIWFKGFSCEQASDCNPAPGIESRFYSIMSDGTGLRQLEITEFPAMLALPENAPAFKQKWAFPPPPPLVSPDNVSAIYIGDDGTLYKVNMADGQATILYTPAQEMVGPYCWTSDEQRVKFLTLTNSSSTMFSVKQSGEELHEAFSFQEVGPFKLGVCSPDYQEMALSVIYSGDKARVGLFIINVNSGESRKILDDFSIWEIRVAPKQ